MQPWDDWRAKLGRDIRECRKRLGWDQVTLAQKATPILYPYKSNMVKRPTVSTETISRIENGANTTTETINALAVALDVEVRVRLHPNNKTGMGPTQSAPSPELPPPNPSQPEQARGLLSDIPPPGGLNGEMDATDDPAAKLARIGAELLEVMEDLETWRQAPVARGSGPGRPAQHRTDRRRQNRRPAKKASTKRR